MNRIRPAALAVSVLAACVPAAPADALVKRSDGGEEIGGGQWQAVAQCRQGERVVSGGYATATGSSITESRAKGKREWVVESNNDLRAFALCSRRLEVSRKSNLSAMTDDTSGTVAKARCARGARAVSGGFRFSGAVGDSPVFRSRPVGRRGWSVRAFDSALDITAYAYCLRDAPELRIRSGTLEIAAGATESAQVACRRGEELLGGGWSVSPKPDWNNNAGPDTFYHRATRFGARTWKVSATNFGQPGRIQPIAICAK
jgi:hypothetical protein